MIVIKTPESTIDEKEIKRRLKRNDGKTVKRVLAAFVPYKFQVFLVFLAILLTTILGLVNPLLIQRIFDDAIGRRDANLLILYVTAMVITPVISGLISSGQTYLNTVIGQRVMRDFRSRLYKHLQYMSLRFFTKTRTGEIQSRISNDVNSAQTVVTDTATRVVTNISTAVSTMIAMMYISPPLTLISLGLLPVFLWITYKVGNVRRRTGKATQQSMASLTAIMQETLSVSGILLIKIFGLQTLTQKKFGQENEKLADLGVRQQMVGRWFFLFIGIFFSITPAIVYLVAGWEIIHHAGAGITLGGIIAFTTLQSRLFAPLGQLLSVQVEIQGAFALFDRIFEYLDLPIEIQDSPQAKPLAPEDVQGAVSFAGVSFTYKGNDPGGYNDRVNKDKAGVENKKNLNDEIIAKEVLHDVSFSIQPGQLAAFVGPSGAGKTTITYLLSRLYDVDNGTVEIDGINIKNISLDSLSRIVCTVTQETYLFHTSIKENLLYVRPDATEEEMIAATKAAAIHERIMELDDDYDTIVGERGYKLSGGEKQRIAIARVLLKDPRILILDEATSALDTHSERLIQTALEPLMKGRTTIAIAHRLSTILTADIIFVLDEGEIVERGTHQELLKCSGVYSRLYHEQFSSQAEEVMWQSIITE